MPSLQHAGLLLAALLLPACGGEESTTESPRPAGSLVHEQGELTYQGEPLSYRDETSDAAAQVTIRGDGDEPAVQLTLEMTLGVADVTFADGSRGRRRAPRRIAIRLDEATTRLSRAACERSLNGQLADPPATLFASCSFTVEDDGIHSVVVFGDGQVERASSTDTAVEIELGGPPLPVLPGDPPGALSQYVVAGDDGRVRVLDEPPEGPAIELAPPTTWRTQLAIALAPGRVEAVLTRVDAQGRQEEGEPRSVTVEGALTAETLASLFEGHESWATPVAAILSAPASASHRDVATLIDAARSHGIERFRLTVQDE